MVAIAERSTDSRVVQVEGHKEPPLLQLAGQAGDEESFGKFIETDLSIRNIIFGFPSTRGTPPSMDPTTVSNGGKRHPAHTIHASAATRLTEAPL
jgi:hypothetical protein